MRRFRTLPGCRHPIEQLPQPPVDLLAARPRGRGGERPARRRPARRGIRARPRRAAARPQVRREPGRETPASPASPPSRPPPAHRLARPEPGRAGVGVGRRPVAPGLARSRPIVFVWSGSTFGRAYCGGGVCADQAVPPRCRIPPTGQRGQRPAGDAGVGGAASSGRAGPQARRDRRAAQHVDLPGRVELRSSTGRRRSRA